MNNDIYWFARGLLKDNNENNDIYWFARGYFDARHGNDFDMNVTIISDACWDAYDRGYECGLAEAA